MEDMVVEVNIILKWTLNERVVEIRENVYVFFNLLIILKFHNN